MFVKVPRSNGDARKGYCWKINPDYDHILSDENESHLTEHKFSRPHAKATAKAVRERTAKAATDLRDEPRLRERESRVRARGLLTHAVYPEIWIGSRS